MSRRASKTPRRAAPRIEGRRKPPKGTPSRPRTPAERKQTAGTAPRQGRSAKGGAKSSPTSPPLKRILVANRGEIAVRVIRACHEMGIWSIAIYSDADREALHVLHAREAYNVGPPPAAASYLDIERILSVARRSSADAIHPGYGFLAENAEFARACRDAGFVFIGPSPEAMERMGDKVRARHLMQEAGVPVVPGTSVLSGDVAEVAGLASKLGYPVLLKAAAGGGGKGMRVVRRERDLPSLLAQARGEAASSFGDERVFLEKYLARPRHIEVQILADANGSCVHLGERECSIQRRHQKLIEECPSPVVDEATRYRIGEMAVTAAKAAGYSGAGTVEFLRDADGSFFFMEMNTRLQVEHPTTEMVTGLDLVKAQIDVAAGRPLGVSQEEIVLRGHAIECRIIAEDPSRNFAPSPGKIRGLRAPSGPGIRYDGGIYAGYTVPIHYDPLLSKLIAWGRDRPEAISRMARALDEYRIEGLETSVTFHRKVLKHPAFLEGDLHIAFLDEHPELLGQDDDPWLDEIALVAAAVARFREAEKASARGLEGDRPRRSGWKWQDRGEWPS